MLVFRSRAGPPTLASSRPPRPKGPSKSDLPTYQHCGWLTNRRNLKARPSTPTIASTQYMGFGQHLGIMYKGLRFRPITFRITVQGGLMDTKAFPAPAPAASRRLLDMHDITVCLAWEIFNRHSPS